MALNRMRKRRVQDFMRARMKERRKKRNRNAKPMQEIGGEKKEALQRNVEANLSEFIN